MTKSKKRGLLAAGIVLAVLLIAALCAWLIWGNVKLINFSNTWSVNHALAADPGDPITILAEADYKDKKFILYTDPIDESENVVHRVHLQKQSGFPNSYTVARGGSSKEDEAQLRFDPVERESNTYFVYNTSGEAAAWSLFEVDYDTAEAVRKITEIDTPAAPFVIVRSLDVNLDNIQYMPMEGSISLEEMHDVLDKYAKPHLSSASK